MIKRIIAFTLILLLPFTLAGCWGKRELNEIGIITVTGIDLEPDGEVRITVPSVQPEGTATTPTLRSNTWIGTATGQSLMDASKNLRSIAVKDLSWLHNMLVVVGQDVARSSMDMVMDFVARNREFRYSSYVLVTEGRACDMLQVPANVHRDLAVAIEGIVLNVDEWSKAHVANIKEFMVESAEKNMGSITGRLWYYKTSRNTVSVPREEYEKKRNH